MNARTFSVGASFMMTRLDESSRYSDGMALMSKAPLSRSEKV
jgi:hypothetical protein